MLPSLTAGVSVWSYTDTGTVRTISDLKNAAAGLATVKASDEEEESWYSDEEDNAKPSVKPAPSKATKKQSSSDEEGGWYSDEDDARLEQVARQAAEPSQAQDHSRKVCGHGLAAAEGCHQEVAEQRRQQQRQ
jgi:phage protein D